MNVIYPVILSGGSGNPLELSRAMYPKQFISVFNDRGSSLLATTLQRLASTDGFAQPTIICNNDHRFLVKEDAERAGVKPRAVVLEPLARNTAPAAAVAALLIERADPAGILVVMPSDHVVKDEAGFVAAVRLAAEVAETDKLVLLGITPNAPHTGYGYIRRGLPLPGFSAAHIVEAFTEKPDAGRAAGYLSAGTYSWNSGIFIFRARAYLDELARLQPSIWRRPRRPLPAPRRTSVFCAWRRRRSPRHPASDRLRRHGAARAPPPWCRSISVGAMSAPGRRCGRFPPTMRPAMPYAARRSCDTSNCYVHAEGVVAAIGVKDLVIVDTPDALLVADRARAQDVSAIVARLKAQTAKSTPNTAQPPSLGLFRDPQLGPALPGQAAARQARRQALHADAPPSLRALGGRARHGQGVDRRGREARARERVGLHHGHPMASAGEPRQDAARADRGAERQLSRRGRHHPQRRRLQPRSRRDEVGPPGPAPASMRHPGADGPCTRPCRSCGSFVRART